MSTKTDSWSIKKSKKKKTFLKRVTCRLACTFYFLWISTLFNEDPLTSKTSRSRRGWVPEAWYVCVSWPCRLVRWRKGRSCRFYPWRLNPVRRSLSAEFPITGSSFSGNKPRMKGWVRDATEGQRAVRNAQI